MNGPFPQTPFISINIISVDRDHLIAKHEGTIKRYAVGHLPHSSLVAIRIGINRVTLLDLEHRTTLGIAGELVIDGVHERAPLINDITLDLMRACLEDPTGSLRSYAQNAAVSAEMKASEYSSKIQSWLYYQRSSGPASLGVSVTDAKCTFTSTKIIAAGQISEIGMNAAVGMKLREVFGHPFLTKTEAIITSITKVDGPLTIISFTPKTLAVTSVLEMTAPQK